MTQENVEVVRRTIEAWYQHDLDSALRFLAADIEWRPASPAAVERSVYRGHAEVIATGSMPSGTAGTSSASRTSEVRDAGRHGSCGSAMRDMRASTSGIELDA